jgi:hypothetical protein
MRPRRGSGARPILTGGRMGERRSMGAGRRPDAERSVPDRLLGNDPSCAIGRAKTLRGADQRGRRSFRFRCVPKNPTPHRPVGM